MKYFALTFVALMAYGYGALLPKDGTSCTKSSTCPTESCCRDGSGTGSPLVTQMGGFQFLNPNQRGMCSTKMAQLREGCDFHCHCDTGLKCYRPLTGMCCAPSRCETEAYVKKQNEYWANCMKDPMCQLPA